jgi:hypothetical protein
MFPHIDGSLKYPKRLFVVEDGKHVRLSNTHVPMIAINEIGQPIICTNNVPDWHRDVTEAVEISELDKYLSVVHKGAQDDDDDDVRLNEQYGTAEEDDIVLAADAHLDDDECDDAMTETSFGAGSSSATTNVSS